jgi:GYF domain 2
MMAEAIDWDDSSTVSGQPVAADEAWHVAVAPDDIKVVSLEQLDDLFRLSLVDSDTKVWQPGMSAWVSLGEIAGLDEEPAPPPPKRTHPKPPSPRSAPPSPQRSAPPAPRSVAPPASFYAAPIVPVTYATPLAPIPSLAPIASVRPLVVSQNPYPMPQRGGGFGRFIVGLALVAGVGVTLYRNDVLRDAAHSVHQDGLYAQLEQKLGGPSFGTLRAVEQSANGEASETLAVDNVTGNTAAAATGESTALANAVAAPTPKPAEIVAAASNAGQPPVVSLESLGTEKSGAATVAAAAAPIARATTASSFVSTPLAKAAPVAKPAPIAKAAPPPPEPKAAPVEKAAPPPVASKPESEMTPRERLNAEIAKSMLGSPASAKKSNKQSSTGLKGSGEYDPLNPKL